LKSKNAFFRYDDEGNLVEKIENNNKTWRYRWNANGLLQAVTRPDGHVVSFTYDVLGRRLTKQYKSTVTKWLWDGNKPLHEWKENLQTGQTLSNTALSEEGIITWLFNERNFAPTAKLKGEKSYSIVSDHLGTPYQMYKENGDKFWEAQLDSFGSVRMLKGDEGSCPFKYQGQYEDVETGLYYNRFRYYDAQEGFYISQDPIRLRGGRRLYQYAKNTTIYIDVFGLTCSYEIYTDENGQQRIRFIAEEARTEKEATEGRNYTTEARAGLNEHGEVYVHEGRHRAIGAAHGDDIPYDRGGRGPGVLDYPYEPNVSSDRGVPVKDLAIDYSEPDVPAEEADRIWNDKYGF